MQPIERKQQMIRSWKWNSILCLGVLTALMLSRPLMAAAHDDDDEGPRRPPATRPTTRPGGGAGGPVSLHREMETMGREFKALQKQINDPAQNVSSLALVTELQQHTM